MTSVGNKVTVNWSIEGIPDSAITFVSRVDNPEYPSLTYAAPVSPGQSYTLSMNYNSVQLLSNSIPLQRQAIVDIPYTRCLWRSQLVWHWNDGQIPVPILLTHRDLYVPNRVYPTMQVLAAIYDSQTNHWPDVRAMEIVYINIIPTEALKIGYLEWLKGLPEYTGFEPPVKYHKPDGCSGCTPMGLPGYRVNLSTLNLVVEDIDYSYASPGPDPMFKRTWNADPAVTGMFGRGWTFSMDSYLSGTPISASRYGDSGQAMYFDVPPSSVNTNLADGNIPIYWVTNSSERVAGSVGPLASWDGNYIVPPGESRRFRLTNDTARGVLVYEWYDPDNEKTWFYEGTNLCATWIPLVRIEDGNSNRLTVGYNGTRLTNVTDAVGRTTTFRYDAQGRCTNMLLPGGAVCAYRYDANGNLVESRDTAGNTTVFAYDPRNYMTNMSTEGRTWVFTWATGSAHGVYTRINTVADPLGRTNVYTLFDESMNNRAVWRDDPGGGFWWHISSEGQATHVIDPLDRNTYTTYDNGWPVLVTNSSGCAKSMSYDKSGRMLRRVNYDGALETWGYDAKGRVVAATNALGQALCTTYDSRGNLTRLVSRGGREQRWDYNALGFVTGVVNAAGERSGMSYNALGNLVRVTDPAGYSVSFGYDAAGLDVVAMTNRRGFVTRYEYDGLRRVTRVIRPDGTSERTIYDCCTQAQKIDGNSRTTTVERNALLWPTATIDALGRRTTYAYNKLDKTTQIVDPLGRTNAYGYDVLGRLVAYTNALGRAVYYSYDDNDNVTSISTNPYINNYFNFGYDCMNRMQYIQDPLYRSVSYIYDSMGRLTNSYNARYQQISCQYDADSLLIGRVENGQASTFGYDAAMRLTNFSNAAGSYAYVYDARGYVTSVRYPNGRSVSFARDAAGNAASMTYPDGTTVTYAYDSRDRVTNMVWGANWIHFAYDAESHPLREQRSNGGETLWGYDALYRATGVLHRIGTTNLIQIAYYRDLVGQTTNIAKQGGLIPWQTMQSPATNRAGFDAANAITQRNASVYGSDADGNVTNGPGFAATYDVANRLTSITRNGTNSVWSYDALSRRVSVTASGTVRRFYYDYHDRLLFETDGSDRITALYIYRGFALVAAQFAGQGAHFYHSDKNGNTIAMTDAQGKFSALYRYTAYGEVTGSYSRVSNPFTFVGRYGVMEEGGGLYYMKHRCYDASSGHFLQRDPLGLSVGLNLYAYVEGNPADSIDPSGLDGDEAEDGGGGVDQSEMTYNHRTGEFVPARPADWIVPYDDVPNILEIIESQNPDLTSELTHEQLLDQLNDTSQLRDKLLKENAPLDQQTKAWYREARIWCLIEEVQAKQPGYNSKLEPMGPNQLVTISSDHISRGVYPYTTR